MVDRWSHAGAMVGGGGLLLRSSVQLDDSWRGGRDPKKSEAGCRAGPATRPGGPVRTFWRRRPHRIYRLAPQLPAFGRGLVGLLCPVLGSGLGSRPPRPPLGAPGGPDFVTERPLVAATCNEMGAIAPLWLLVARRLGRIVTFWGFSPACSPLSASIWDTVALRRVELFPNGRSPRPTRASAGVGCLREGVAMDGRRNGHGRGWHCGSHLGEHGRRVSGPQICSGAPAQRSGGSVVAPEQDGVFTRYRPIPASPIPLVQALPLLLLTHHRAGLRRQRLGLAQGAPNRGAPSR